MNRVTLGVLAAGVVCVMACAQTGPKGEAELIAVLKSEATQQEKADACLALGHRATKAAVPALAALLADEQLAHMARYALEPLPDPSVDEALRAALDKLSGRPLAGVAQSVGVRRDAQAVAVLGRRLSEPDAEVAAAVALALGRIGTPEAAAALMGALGRVPEAAEGLLRCAEVLPTGQARTIYDGLRDARVPPQVLSAATRGAILARGAGGVTLLVETLRAEDEIRFVAGLRAALELPGAEVTRALAGELGKLAAVRQGRLCEALGERGDTAASPALLALARGSEASETRLAAIRALVRLGDDAAVPALAELVVAGDEAVAKAASAALAGHPGQAAEAEIAKLLRAPDVKARRIGVELAARRRLTAAVPDLLRLAAEEDAECRTASLKALGELADAKAVPELVGLLEKSPATEAVADALAAVCARAVVRKPLADAIQIRKALYGVLADGPVKDVTAKVAELVQAGERVIEAGNGTFGDAAPGKVKQFRLEYTVSGVARQVTAMENASVRLEAGTSATVPPEVSGSLLAAFERAQGAPKRALLRLLCTTGGEQALSVVRKAVSDADAELREVALRAICEWPSQDALPDLERLVQAPPSPKFKILAWRGYMRLVEADSSPAQARFAALQKAFGWAERDEERRVALGSLGVAPCPEALAFALSNLTSDALKEEACRGAVDVAEALQETEPGACSDALRQVLKAGPQEATLKRARKLLGVLKKGEEQARSEEGFVPLCNGRDLEGWEQKGGAWWKVVEGVVTAESTADAPLVANNHLIWKGGTPGDFEIRADFRLSKSANSGIQLRAEAVAERDTGYQADMNGAGNYVGFLYHPKMHLIGGRGERVTIAADGKKSAQRFADAAELQKLYRVEDWNSYRVVCKGPTITLYLNGVLTTQVTDLRPDTPLQGAVTLQIHKGPPMKIEYRNLRLKTL